MSDKVSGNIIVDKRITSKEWRWRRALPQDQWA